VAYAGIGGSFVYLLLMLKSFVFNIYMIVMNSLRWEYRQNWFERESLKLKYLADQRIKLDLDDGVKVNNGKFGELLAEVKAIIGMVFG